MREQIKNKGIRSQPYPLLGNSPFLWFFRLKQEEGDFFHWWVCRMLSLSLINSFWFGFISKSDVPAVSGFTELLDLYLHTYSKRFFL